MGVDPDGLELRTISETSDRQYRTNYYAKTVRSLATLRANGQRMAANDLPIMLNQGLISVETDPNKLSAKDGNGQTFVAGAVTRAGVSIDFNPDSFRSSAFLEMTYLHEWVHVMDYRRGFPGNEQFATFVTAAYARLRFARKMPDGSHMDWRNIAQVQVDYGKRFFGRDVARFGNWLSHMAP